ncbi:MAG: PilZ domain-containing protein [Magnetococcales bacterium]|nr:PilZ domain-containing protein [Magnetococcales bacterium]
MSSNEKRQFQRLDSQDAATLFFDQKTIPGTIEDLGLGGIFFVPENVASADIQVGNVCDVEMIWCDRPMKLTCKIASARENGFGIEIQRQYSVDDLNDMIDSSDA